ncbi:DM13 domain-containing protein [Gordonia iterans]
MPRMKRVSRRTAWVLGGVAVVVAVVLVVAGAVFQPWLLWVNNEVDDAIPSATTRAQADPSGASPAPSGPVILSTGSFISHEHTTTGSASIIENPDGSRLLAIENLSTTTGPDVNVWLSAGEVIPGRAGWFTAADAPRVDLGDLKGNRGNQVYPIPADVDLARYGSVVLWCVRFSVSFGAAELHRA